MADDKKRPGAKALAGKKLKRAAETLSNIDGRPAGKKSKPYPGTIIGARG